MTRTVYYISDGTGISAEALGHSLMTQFDQVSFQSITLPYIDTEEKAKQAVSKINESGRLDNIRPIVFSTIVKPEIRRVIRESQGLCIDFFHSFIGTLEEELNIKASELVGLTHGVGDQDQYNTRIEAVNYSLHTDDGINTSAYKTADIILLGVSRTGKTPTCLYLALQHGIRAANYPLTPEDLGNTSIPVLPSILHAFRDRLFGLTISSDRLHQIRLGRRPESQYASINQCKEEIHFSESLFQKEKIPYLNSTDLSIEELSTHILLKAELKRGRE